MGRLPHSLIGALTGGIKIDNSHSGAYQITSYTYQSPYSGFSPQGGASGYNLADSPVGTLNTNGRNGTAYKATSLNAARLADSKKTLQPAALLSAAASGDTAQTTALLNQGAALEARDEAGRTPLMLAVMQRKPEVVRLLLDRGADPNVADSAGRTPLQQAKQDNLREIAALLDVRVVQPPR